MPGGGTGARRRSGDPGLRWLSGSLISRASISSADMWWTRLFLLQYYDVTAREMESYGLKAAAQHFGLAEEGRTYIEGKDIQWYFDHDPDSLKKYNLEDVKETLALSELLGYPFFLQARIFPYSYQNIFVRGNATKINALFLREYLRQRASVPKPKGGRGIRRGLYGCLCDRGGAARGPLRCGFSLSLHPPFL